MQLCAWVEGGVVTIPGIEKSSAPCFSMNVRPLVPSGVPPLLKGQAKGQADMGRARASWGGKPTVTFDTSLAVLADPEASSQPSAPSAEVEAAVQFKRKSPIGSIFGGAEGVFGASERRGNDVTKVS